MGSMCGVILDALLRILVSNKIFTSLYLIFINSFSFLAIRRYQKISNRIQYAVCEKNIFRMAIIGGIFGVLIASSIYQYRMRDKYYLIMLLASLLVNVYIMVNVFSSVPILF